MNKKEFTDIIARKTGRTAPEVNKLLDALAITMAEVLQTSDCIQLPSIGDFSTVIIDEKIEKNPDNGHNYLIPPRVNTIYTPANSLVGKLKNSDK